MKKHATLFVLFEGNGCLWGEGQWLGLSVCRGFYLDCSNLEEKLCDEWVLSASVCGTGSFSAHTATHSINESAHETQSFSPKSRNPNKPQNSILNNSTSCFTIEPWIHKHEEKWLQVSYLSFSYAASFLTMCLTAQSFRRAFRIRFLRMRGLMAPGLNMPSAVSVFQSRRQLSVRFAALQEIPDIYREHRLF